MSSTSSSRKRIFTRWPVQHRDRVVDDLGPVGSHGLPPRSESRDTIRPGATKMDHEKRKKLLRRLSGRSRDLELDARRAVRILSCQSLEPASLRWRNVIPARASESSGVSK